MYYYHLCNLIFLAFSAVCFLITVPKALFVDYYSVSYLLVNIVSYDSLVSYTEYRDSVD